MVIKIHPNGNVTTLYADSKRSLLDDLGKLSIERASNVEFKDNLWVVTRQGKSLIDKGFPLREDAIRAEIAFLEETL